MVNPRYRQSKPLDNMTVSSANVAVQKSSEMMAHNYTIGMLRRLLSVQASAFGKRRGNDGKGMDLPGVRRKELV